MFRLPPILLRRSGVRARHRLRIVTHSAANGDTVTANGDTVTADGDAVAADGDAVAADGDAVPLSYNPVC